MPSTLPLPLLVVSILAAGLPVWWNHPTPPVPTVLNQCLAVSLWGLWALALAPRGRPRGATPLLIVLGVLAAAALWSWIGAFLPASIALNSLAQIAAAAVLLWAGAHAALQVDAAEIGHVFLFGLLVSAVVLAVVGLLQVFAPGLDLGGMIAATSAVGRAVGNLRQPNHLCTLLLWGLVAACALQGAGRLPRAALVALALLLVFGIELSASRSGALGLLLFVAWALLDRRLPSFTRGVMLALPLLYGAFWLLAGFSGQEVGAAARFGHGEGVGEGPSPNSRLNIWRNALTLALSQPLGVGFGEFNFAWTLTPFAGRPTALFDHAHNLTLHWAAELGLPLAVVLTLLLLWALGRAALRSLRAEGREGGVARAATMIVALAFWHGQVEYPWWYSYFLLPSAFAWGFALAVPAGRRGATAAHREPSGTSGWPGALAGALLVVGGAFAGVEAWKVTQIYQPAHGTGSTLRQRIEAGRATWLFAHHADYAAATNAMPPELRRAGMAGAMHALIDTRLGIDVADELGAEGRPALASHLAARLGEFGHEEARELLDRCRVPGRPQPQPPAHWCNPPSGPVDWREFGAWTRSLRDGTPPPPPRRP